MQIGHKVTGDILFEAEGTVREVVVAAIRQNVSLAGAKLAGADLAGADLSEADLREADLKWSNLR